MTYELHPLCVLFPRLTGAEFDALREDIRANGLRSPIITHNGMILDGGNRYRACVEAGVEPEFSEFTGDNLVSFVMSANLHRRHMSAGQQAAIVASAQDWAGAQAVGRPAEKSGNVAGLATVAERAAASGASDRTQRMADKVAKADPELSRKVAHGEVTLPKAHAEVSGKAAPAPAAPAAEQMDDGPSLSELVDELQRENESLTGQLKATEADDLKAEALKWRRAYDHALRQQSEAMERAAESVKREARTMKALRRCGKAVGEEDPDKIAPAVEAMARQVKKVAA